MAGASMMRTRFQSRCCESNVSIETIFRVISTEVSMSNLNDNLRHVPSVDQLLRTDAARELRDRVGPRRATNIARSVIAEVRAFVRDGADRSNKPMVFWLKPSSAWKRLLSAKASPESKPSSTPPASCFTQTWAVRLCLRQLVQRLMKRRDIVRSNTTSRVARGAGEGRA